MKKFFVICLLVLSGLTLSGCGESGPAMVSTANPHASRAAAEMLKRGGSAIDAAIAAQMVLGLVEPQSSGIGGGAFAVYYDAENAHLTTFDGREKAPSAANEKLFLDADGKPMKWGFVSIGGRPVGVPGVIALSWKAHKKFGRLSWAELFEPAIKLAEQGFEASPRMVEAVWRSRDHLRRDDGARGLYFAPATLAPVRVGQILKNPDYAKTLKTIAEKGRAGFYTGPVAKAIVAAVQGHFNNAGSMTLDDLKNYTAVERKAVCSIYRKYKVCGMPPPTSGGLTSQMILGMLEPYNLSEMRPGSATAMHLFTQASRLAYADRGLYMADTDFVDVPMAKLLDKTYLRKRSALINPLVDMGRAKPGKVSSAVKKAASLKTPEYGTSHLSIVDDQGNAISMTTSVERSFGSHMVVGGFVLNSQLTDFSFVPERNGMKVANRVQGNKRPRSSMTPTIIFAPDGKLFAAIGSPGGSRIIEFVTRTVIALIDWQLPMQAAIDLGNVNNRNGNTELEAGTPAAGFLELFKSMGHKAMVKPLISGLHGVRITAAGLDGGADKRREGLVIRLGK